MFKIKEEHRKLRLQVSGFCQCIIWSMATMLRDSVVVVVVVSVVVVRTSPREIPLATTIMKRSIHGFPFLSHMSIWGSAWRP